MKKIVLLLSSVVLLAGCMASGGSQADENMTVLADEIVRMQASMAEMQNSMIHMQSTVDEANIRNEVLIVDMAQLNETVTELQTEVSYLNNEVSIARPVGKGQTSVTVEAPMLITPNGSVPVVEAEESKSPRIVIIEDVQAMRNSLYSYAYELYRKKEHTESIAKFEEFIAKMPNDDLADNAQYWIGENYYSMRDYPNALKAFQAVIKNYPNEGKVPDAMLKEGYTYRNMGQNAKATESLNNLVRQYPRSDAAKLAQQTLAKWK